MSGNVQTILVINMMHIGDLMLVTPALRALRSAYPDAQITLLTDKVLKPLVAENRCIDKCLAYDKHGRGRTLHALLKFIAAVRQRHYDLVINLHRNERASAIAAFSGAKRIIGYSKPFFSLFFDKVLQNPSIAHHIGWGPNGIFPPHRYVPGWKHQVEAHFDVLREGAGIKEIDDRGLELWVPIDTEEKAELLWETEFQPGEKVVAFNIGASWETKRWPTEYFAACAHQLIHEGYAVAFFGGPGDIKLVEMCTHQIPEQHSDKIHVFTGKVSLTMLAALLSRCCLMLTTDSGPMHVGVAMNVPIVTMFGASPVPGFYPYDSKDILVQADVPCHPCGLHECPREGAENFACMRGITPEVVMRYVEELLEKYRGTPARELPPHPGQYKCRVVKP